MTSLSPLVVVEDNDEDFEALSRVLRETTSSEGVVRYGTGEEAIAGLMAGERPAIVILDLNLPGMRGDEVCRALGDLPTRVLILSASGEQHDVLAAIKAGATGYLVKSASAQQIVDAVRATARGEAVFTPGLAGLRAVAEVTLVGVGQGTARADAGGNDAHPVIALS